MSSFTTRDIERMREEARRIRAQVREKEAEKAQIRKGIKEREEELKTLPPTSERAKILKKELDELRHVLFADKRAEFPLGKGGRKTRKARKSRKTRSVRKTCR